LGKYKRKVAANRKKYKGEGASVAECGRGETMNRQMTMWLARTFFVASLVCFGLGMWGDAPRLLKSVPLLVLVYLMLVVRVRRMSAAT
jgi:hypothetical protein